MQPEVDVVIAVHTPMRPVERAVESVLSHTRAPVRITVVAHNTESAAILTRLKKYVMDSRVRILEHHDSFQTPAGPKNKGLDLATAQYVAMLDSDDELEPGAIDAWLSAAFLPEGLADVVLAPTSTLRGDLHPSPPIRWTRTFGQDIRTLDPVKDRLAYRSAPLGLIRREKLGATRFSEGIPTGEDQPISAELWFADRSRLVFPIHAPRYLEHHDQNDRVTRVERSVREEFLSLDRTLAANSSWVMNPSARLSIAAKLIRVNLFDSVRNRVLTGWDKEVSIQLAEVADRILAWEPKAEQVLSRADTRLLRALKVGTASKDHIDRLIQARNRSRSFDALMTHRVHKLFHCQAPLRYHLAGAILLRRGRQKR